MESSCPSKDPVTFRPAVPADAGGIRQLLRESPFGRRISLTLEPEPDHPLMRGGHTRKLSIIATRESEPHAILGLAGRTGHAVWVNKHPARIGYLGQLRSKSGENLTLHRLREGYNMLEAERRDDELAFDYTCILADNTPARRLLERGLPGLPRYEAAGTMTTLTISTARARHRREPLKAGPLAPADHERALECLQRHHRRRQLAPQLDTSFFDLPGTTWLHTTRNKRTTGCLALWNQATFKTITVQGYTPWLRRFRHPVNILRRLQGAPDLPAPGQILPLAFLAFLCADHDDPETTASLIATAAHAAARQKLTHLCLGLPAVHPVLPVLRTSLRPETTDSIIYLVHPSNGTTRQPLDPDLPVHPEIALL